MNSGITAIEVMRYMEWEHAKGSLRAILASYTESDQENISEWRKLDKLLGEFIKSFGELSGCD